MLEAELPRDPGISFALGIRACASRPATLVLNLMVLTSGNLDCDKTGGRVQG